MPRPILIIEDDPLVGDMISRFLQRRYSVVLVQDGAKAIAACEKYQPAVILLDIALPNKDGRDILRELRARGDALAKTPVIIATNFDKDIAQYDELEKLGISGFYVKAHLMLDDLFKKIQPYFDGSPESPITL